MIDDETRILAQMHRAEGALIASGALLVATVLLALVIFGV